MLDLLIPGQTPGIKTEVVDLYGKLEILFFGPDGEQRSVLFGGFESLLTGSYQLEGTAVGLMD